MTQQFLTTEQAAAETGVSVRTVQHLVKTQVVPAQRVGRDWFIRRADLGRIRARRGPGRPRKNSENSGNGRK